MKKAGAPNAQNYSTIQTNFDTVQTGPSKGGNASKVKKGNSLGSKGHQRYATTTYSTAANNLTINSMNTLQQPNPMKKNSEKTSSKVAIKQTKNMKEAKRAKNQTVTGSGSIGIGLNMMSPQNVPTNSLAFSFLNNYNMNQATTPQDHNHRIGMPGGGGRAAQNPTQMFTIDSPGTYDQMIQPSNFSNQLISTLQPLGQNSSK